MNLDFQSVRELSGNLSALIVEDEAYGREHIKKALGFFFKEIYTGRDGLDGLEVFEQHKESIDVVFTDVQMPRMNGLEMIKRIKEIDYNIQLIVVSAHNEINYFLKAIDIGVDGFIIKPIQSGKMLEIVYKSCSAIKNRKENSYYQEHLENTLKKRTRELENHLITDPLTGIYNKTKLDRDISSKREITVFLVNIDNFDAINSTYGYYVGDIALSFVASVLREMCPEDAKLYRLASDEMVFVFDKINEDERIKSFAEEVNANIQQRTTRVDEIEINLTCTIGVASSVGKEALVSAHIAVKEVREIGKNRFYIHSGESPLVKKQQNNIEWMKRVKKALLEDTIIPYFQPIINNATGEVEKYESLARIRDVEKIISPYYFIEPARLVGLLPNITKVILAKSFERFSGLEGVEFSVNITENDLKENFLSEYLEELVQRFSIAPSRVVLEILENISADGHSCALDQLYALKERGFKLAMDDFGSEKSNFYRFHKLNVDYIKIDGMFIKDIHTNHNSYQITKAIVEMAKSFGIKTIAEFVHANEVQEIIKELGIDCSQGYLFGEPKSGEMIWGR